MFPSFLVVYIQKRDPRALRKESKKGSTESIDKITSRVSRPTTASTASRHDFDAQDCHIDYLKKTCELYYRRVLVMETFYRGCRNYVHASCHKRLLQCMAPQLPHRY